VSGVDTLPIECRISDIGRSERHIHAAYRSSGPATELISDVKPDSATRVSDSLVILRDV
jgi:hypothetical protein